MQLNFTFAGLDAARSSLSRISDLVFRLRAVKTSKGSSFDLEPFKERFKAALGDDLNISIALSVLFDLIRELNTHCDAETLSHQDATKALSLFGSWDEILGLSILKTGDEEIPQELLSFLERRESARREKNFKVSDEMRDAILARGYLIEDTPSGARLKKK